MLHGQRSTCADHLPCWRPLARALPQPHSCPSRRLCTAHLQDPRTRQPAQVVLVSFQEASQQGQGLNEQVLGTYLEGHVHAVCSCQQLLGKRIPLGASDHDLRVAACMAQPTSEALQKVTSVAALRGHTFQRWKCSAHLWQSQGHAPQPAQHIPHVTSMRPQLLARQQLELGSCLSACEFTACSARCLSGPVPPGSNRAESLARLATPTCTATEADSGCASCPHRHALAAPAGHDTGSSAVLPDAQLSRHTARSVQGSISMKAGATHRGGRRLSAVVVLLHAQQDGVVVAGRAEPAT